MKSIVLGALAAFFLFFSVACTQKQNEDSEVIDAAHNSQNSLDWAGTYRGVIPAADCPGIQVEIVLNSNGNYTASYKYIDRGDEVYKYAGTFTWNNSGNIITLNDADIPPYYKVGENILIQLDMSGNEITGDLADNYILSKDFDLETDEVI